MHVVDARCCTGVCEFAAHYGYNTLRLHGYVSVPLAALRASLANGRHHTPRITGTHTSARSCSASVPTGRVAAVPTTATVAADRASQFFGSRLHAGSPCMLQATLPMVVARTPVVAVRCVRRGATHVTVVCG